MTSERFRKTIKLFLCAACAVSLPLRSIRVANSAPPGPQADDTFTKTPLPTTGAEKDAGTSPEIAGPPVEAATPERQKPGIRKIAENTYRITDITVDTKQRTVTFPARENLREGVLEVLICTEYGKTHESLVSTQVDPLHLNVAFLLLGLEGGHAVKHQGDPTKPVGSPVEIWLKVNDKEEKKPVRAEDWVYNTQESRPMLRTNWVYVGSVVTEDGFMAQRLGQIVTTFHDPFALIDNPLPGGGDDTVYVPNTKEVPPLGTEIIVVIKAVPPSLKRR